MSKKKFSEGLDDLFRDQSAGEEFWGQASEAPVRERKAAHKNFMHDLDLLLQEALDESLDNAGADDDLPAAAGPRTKSKTTTGAYHRSSISGLDALIRQTIDVQEIHTDEETGKKRLTVAVDKTKLEKLKTIARLENAYMKDILVQLIDEYIREYTKEKGFDF